MTENKTQESLHAKIAAVMAAVDRIPKRGTNTHFGYAFATEADVSDAIRSELSSRNVATYVSSQINAIREGKTSSGKATLFTDVSISLTFACGDTGETWTVNGAGTGDDPSDKGVYKAISGAVKYALMKTFLVPTGDDPENASDHNAPTAAEFLWPFPGDSKGKPFTEVSDKDLKYMAGRAVKDDKYREQNLKMQKAAESELERRSKDVAEKLPSGPQEVVAKEDIKVDSPALAADKTSERPAEETSSVVKAAVAIAEAVGKSTTATEEWINTRDDKEAALKRVVEQAATSGLDVRAKVSDALKSNGLERFIEMFDAAEIK